MFILIETSPGLEIIARWSPFTNSMVLRSEEILKSEMLSLARTLVRGGHLRLKGLTKLDSYCSDKLIYIYIYIYIYICFLLDNIVLCKFNCK